MVIRYVLYRVVEKKCAQINAPYGVMLQPFAVESCGFRHNAQKLTGNTKNWQILNVVLNILCLEAGKGTT